MVLENDGEVEFRFENILLPDSNVNELESHGFVEYSIMPKKGLPPLAKIGSPAAIYFDFNAPIITNDVLNTIHCYSAPQPVITLNYPYLESGVTGDFEFQWYYQYEAIEDETNSTILPEKDGLYSVRVTDSNTCFRVSKTFDYVMDDIAEANEMNISIYPNPFKAYTTIQFDKDPDGAYDLRVFNMVGAEVVAFNKIKGNQLSIKKETLGSGVFLCYLINSSTGEKVFVDKLISY